jgi:hypothetical protein
LGRTDEALRHVDRCLRRLPEGAVVAAVEMAELGAEICLNVGRLGRMEKYLLIALSTEKHIRRKCDIGFSVNSVRAFRAQHGILDPREAMDDEQRIEAIFEGARRRCREALKAGKVNEARAALAIMEQATNDTQDFWERPSRRQVIIEFSAQIGDSRGVKRNIQKLTKADREEVLNFELLAKIGMKAEAIEAAVREVKRQLAELRTMDDPNIHFPVQEICRALKFLLDQRKKQEATRLFATVANSAKKWPVFEHGWTTSAVYTMFAEVAAVIEGPAAAQHLITQAQVDASTEHRSEFRKSASGAALDMEARLGQLDEAIAKARKLRSPKERRLELCKLLAKAKRWNELKSVCSDAASPGEAADLCWAIKFELTGGDVF